MTSRLRYGILGCGMMGQEHLMNIALLPETEVAAILEPDAGMRAAAHLLVPGARFVETVPELLDAGIDCLVIASPNFLHAGQIAEIAKHRPLPLLVEKPVCTTLEEALELERIGAGYSAPLWVGMEYRYMPPVARLIAEAEERTGGVRMLAIREHRFPFLNKVGGWNRFNRYTGGTLVEKCCHFMDLMTLIMATPPIRIFASAGRDHNHRSETYDGLIPDILDNAFVVVDFEDGRRAMLDLCMFADGARYQEEIAATGPLARIEAFVPGPSRFWPQERLGPAPVPKVVYSPRDPKGPTVLDLPVDKRLLAAGDHNGSTFHQHARFRNAVIAKGKVEVDLSAGLRAVRLGLAAQQSATVGQAVDLVDGPYAIDRTRCH